MSIGVEQALGYVRLLQTESRACSTTSCCAASPTLARTGLGPRAGLGHPRAARGDRGSCATTSAHADAVGKLGIGRPGFLEAMADLQREDGHWFAVVGDPGSGDEYSTAGFMAWAIASARSLRRRRGRADAASVQLAVRRAILESLDADAQLREVYAAVYACTAPQLLRPRAPRVRRAVGAGSGAAGASAEEPLRDPAQRAHHQVAVASARRPRRYVGGAGRSRRGHRSRVPSRRVGGVGPSRATADPCTAHRLDVTSTPNWRPLAGMSCAAPDTQPAVAREQRVPAHPRCCTRAGRPEPWHR